MQLNRRFSPFTMLLLSINGMIGSAWLFGPLYAAKITGASALISWVLAGGMTVLIALTFAELSTLLPIAGGMSRFPQLSHGALTNVIMSWAAWLSCITMPPIEVQATLQYASTYFPSLTHLVNGAPVLTGVGFCWAAVLMLGLSVVNVASFKGLVRFNFALFFFKVLIIFLTILSIIKTSFHGSNFAGLIGGTEFSWQAILTAVATGGVVFAFTGFHHGISMAGETSHSQIAIPLAVIGSIVCCLLMYLGLQIALIGSIEPSALSQGWSKLSFAGEAGPFVGIAALLGLTWLVKLLYVDSVVSPLGAGLIYVTSTARTVYALSKNGYLPKIFSHLNSKGFPVFAIALNFLLGMFLFLPFPGWQAMVGFLVSAVVISYSMGPIALLCLRLQLPKEKRPFRLPFANVLCMLAFYCCNLICYWTGWDTISKLAIAMGIGMIILMVAYYRGMFKQLEFGMKGLIWLAPYLIGLFTISYLGSFGGKVIITFGWDFLVIGVFTIIIMSLAVATRLGTSIEQFKIYKVEGNLI